MNKEIKISLLDLYIGYGCAAFVMYAIGGLAYYTGKAKGKLEVAEKIRDVVQEFKEQKES